MKNIFSTALIAVTVLSLAACDQKHSASSKGPDSTSTTTVKIDSSTKTTVANDSIVRDTVKIAAAGKPATGKKSGGDDASTSIRAVKDSFKKDSAKMSRK